jgi:hypothetical protein
VLKHTHHRGLISQHRHDHLTQSVRRLDHAHHTSIDSFLHSWSIVDAVISLLALLQIFLDIKQELTSTS